MIKDRISSIRPEDDIKQYVGEYFFSENLDYIWVEAITEIAKQQFQPQVPYCQILDQLELEKSKEMEK